jgi:hypothetical protein
MNDNKALTLPEGEGEWHQIVEQILSELSDEDQQLPEKVIQATEMLLAGYPTYKVAKALKVETATVRRWLSAYPTMAMTVAKGKKLLSTWRMARLEQQFLSAIERSQEVLDVSLGGFVTDKDGQLMPVNPKILTVVAAQARYIIGLFAGQQSNVTVKHELGETVMKARKDALDYLAQQLIEQRVGAAEEPIEAVVRVIDPKIDNNGPVLDEHGNPPFGKMGKLDKNEDGMLCHICGDRLKNLSRHLLDRHNTTTEEYEITYMLEEGAVRKHENK